MRRTYPRRRASNKLSRRRVLNITTTKKQDNMLAWTRLGADVSGSSGGATIASNERYWAFGWIATARNADYQSGGPRGTKIDSATRTSTETFMRGVKENIRIELQTNHAYLWRRICFKFKATTLVTDSTTGLEYALWQETSAGYVRALTQLLPSINPTLQLWQQLVDIIFKGQVNVDWSELMTAKTDNSRAEIVYDKTVRLTTGNDVGKMLDVKRWHPMNKNLIYNDDEQGGGKGTPYLSSVNRKSMGDYYIIDIFDTGTTGDADDTLTFTPQATLYWHER
jgi:hypothetical protein